MNLDDFLRRLPESHDGWNCRWFLAICYLSLWLVGLGLTIIPGTLGIVAAMLGCLSLGVALGTRSTNKECER